ncbi:MAG: MarR family winged helix-turn-helix transcriptional regulator [Hyphomonadaceae bacterium]
MKNLPPRTSEALIAIRRIVRAAEFAARDLARRADLTPSQLIVLQHLAARGEAWAGAIADNAQLSHATVTALLDKLEARALIRRRRDSEDRRRVSAEITAEGRQLLAQIPDALQDRFAARFARLDAWEQAGVVSALEHVAALLGAEGIDASPVLDVGSLDRDPEADAEKS